MPELINSIEVKGNIVDNSLSNNLYIVSTVFQLLGAIEAQEYFNTTNNILLILNFGNKNKDIEQLNKLLKIFPYDKLIVFNVYKGKFVGLTIQLLRELNIFKYDKVFTGFFSANLRRIIVNVNYNILFLLDDGVYTISIHNEIYGNFNNDYIKYILPFSEQPRKTKIKKIKFFFYHNFRKLHLFLFGYKLEMRNFNLNFFTMFSLIKYKKELIINHNFSAIKKYFNFNNKIQKDNNIYILGQPLYTRVEHINLEQYIDYIENIFIEILHHNKKIIYIPHRAEDELLLKEIFKKYNITLIIPTINVELYFIENNIYPSHVISFVSTALVSIKKFFPLTYVESFLITPTVKTNKTLELIYKQLKKEGVCLNDSLLRNTIPKKR